MAVDEAYGRLRNAAYAPVAVSHYLAREYGCPTGAVWAPPVAPEFLAAAERAVRSSR